MMKSFFGKANNSLAWTEDANNCDHEIHEALKPIMIKWVKDGYSPREIAHLISGAAISLECEAVMDIRAGRNPFEQ